MAWPLSASPFRSSVDTSRSVSIGGRPPSGRSSRLRGRWGRTPRCRRGVGGHEVGRGRSPRETQASANAGMDTIEADAIRAEVKVTLPESSSNSNSASSASTETPNLPNSAIIPTTSSASAVCRKSPIARISPSTRATRSIRATTTEPPWPSLLTPSARSVGAACPGWSGSCRRTGDRRRTTCLPGPGPRARARWQRSRRHLGGRSWRVPRRGVGHGYSSSRSTSVTDLCLTGEHRRQSAPAVDPDCWVPDRLAGVVETRSRRR